MTTHKTTVLPTQCPGCGCAFPEEDHLRSCAPSALPPKWMRHRFRANLDDSRPVKFPPPGPWWETGWDFQCAIVVAYLPPGEPVTNWWPEAVDIESTEEAELFFSDRFPKPDWWTE